MKVRRFDPDEDLIIVKARILGRHGSRRLTLAFDTAASHTHVTPDIIDELGYSPAEGEAITSVRSAIGKEPGYMLRVQRFESLGFGSTISCSTSTIYRADSGSTAYSG